MPVSKEDWQSWKSHPVTEAFIQDMLLKADNEIATLVSHAGTDPLSDRKTVGTIAGLTWLVDWSPELEREEVEYHPDREDDEDA